jgi:hypothetical protein
MKRAGIIVGLSAAIFLFGAEVHALKAAGQAGQVEGAPAPDKITPFVLETEVYGFENDPHGGLGIKTTFARRSDGAFVRVENVGPLKLGITGRMIRFMDGRSVTVVNAFKMKTTWSPVRVDQLERFNAQRLRGSPDCLRTAGEVRIGADTLAGQFVVVVRNDQLGGSYVRRVTDWRAPELGCQTLKYRVEDQKADGTWRLMTEGRLVSLKLEEPDPKLFDQGADYAEAKPSDVHRKILEMQGTPVDEATWREQAEQMDRAYPKK